MASEVCTSCGVPFPEGALECPFYGTPAEPEPTHVSVDPLLGQQLGEYRIEARLGMGGMGIVYRGSQPVIGKRVAIKVLRPDLAADANQVQRLVEEAKAVNAIRHRGIIDIFGFGQLPDGRHYIVMEELEGEPLDVLLLREGPLPPSTVLGFMDEILSALGAAHTRGVIHRDLKPNNLFLVHQPGGSQYLKVLDFGLAKRADKPGGRAKQTSLLVVSGTPEYMAPEQARAEPVGPETDLWAIGVILFEMLTGQLPFGGDTPVDVLTNALSKPAPRPSSLAASVPQALEDVVLRLLEKDRSLRPHSAEAVRLDLARVAKQLQVASTQATSVQPELPLGVGATRVVPARVKPLSGPLPSGEATPVQETPLEVTDPATPVVSGSGGKIALLAGGVGALVVVGLVVVLGFGSKAPGGAEPAKPPHEAGDRGTAAGGSARPANGVGAEGAAVGSARPANGVGAEGAAVGSARPANGVGAEGTAVGSAKPANGVSAEGAAAGAPEAGSAAAGGAERAESARRAAAEGAATAAAHSASAVAGGSPAMPRSGGAAPAVDRPAVAGAKGAAGGTVDLEKRKAGLEARLAKLEQSLRARTEPGEEPDAAALALLKKQKLALMMAKAPEQLDRVAKTLDEWQASFLH